MNRRRVSLLFGGAALLALVTTLPLAATSVVHMQLADLTDRAGQVFRGTVLSVEPGTVSAGGAELPTVTYRVQVDEAFKGDFTASKGVAELTMLGTIKEQEQGDGVVRLSRLPELPVLVTGGEYVLFTTPTSPIGLTAPVGLDQGAFKLYLAADRQLMAANGLGNAGLTETINGPVTYETLADAIRQQLGQ